MVFRARDFLPAILLRRRLVDDGGGGSDRLRFRGERATGDQAREQQNSSRMSPPHGHASPHPATSRAAPTYRCLTGTPFVNVRSEQRRVGKESGSPVRNRVE